jgi:hypothetical protein
LAVLLLSGGFLLLHFGHDGTKGTTGGATRVDVKVDTVGYSPVAVTVSRARPGSRVAWMEHDVVFRNATTQYVQLSDSRYLGRLGVPPMIMTGEGRQCGRGGPPPSGGTVVCNTALRLIVVPPGETHVDSIALYRGLHGLGRVRPGQYALEQRIFYRLRGSLPGALTSGDVPSTGNSDGSFTARITYVVH